ncbi:MAG: hypothetical protein GQE15_25385 [Archangiaceae bacterium]|nr:hypothetical protein [Archangiaceae bacterium]
MTRSFVVAVLLVAALAFAGPKKKPAVKKPAPKLAYVSLAAVSDSTNAPNAKESARAALERSLSMWAPVELAPGGETDASATKAITTKKAVGLELSLTLKSGRGDSLDASLIRSSYPGRALEGEYRAGASGAPVLELIGPVVDQLVSELAKDQLWQRAP